MDIDQCHRQCEDIILNKRFQVIGSKRNLKLELAVNTIFIEGDYIYLHVYLNNLSNIPFKMRGNIIFEAVEKSKLKRQTATKVYYEPVYIYNQQRIIRKGKQLHSVYVFKHFSLQEDKKFILHLTEEEGGRDLTLDLQHQEILNAKKL